MGKHKVGEIDWRDFEVLVGRLEQMLGNDSISVKVNDQIRDSTGELRQIDASVRVTTGTTELLYIIECRNRKSVSDVTWVEQVATKCKRVGAVKAILVSNKELSKNASAAARELGVDVRKLANLDGSVLGDRPWMEMASVRWSPSVHVQVLPRDFDDLSQETLGAIDLLLRTDLSRPILSINGDTILTSIQHQIQRAKTNLQETTRFPPGSKGGPVTVEMCTPKRLIEVCIEDKRVPLKSLQFRFEAVIETVAPTRDYLGEYSASGGLIEHFVREQTVVSQGEEMSFTMAAKRDNSSLIVNIPYAFGDDSVRENMDPERGATIELFFDEKNEPHLRRLH